MRPLFCGLYLQVWPVTILASCPSNEDGDKIPHLKPGRRRLWFPFYPRCYVGT